MAKKKAIVLGAGMVGSVMAADLAADDRFEVTIADRSREALDRASSRIKRSIATTEADLSNAEAVKRLVEPCDLVLGALASAIGFQTLQAVIEAGRPYCDISFMPENALELDALAKERGVTAIVDCGVAPGMSNLLAGYGTSQLDSCERIEIYVGGIPREPKPPFMYKAAFSPADVVEEYTRPARIVENGTIVTREALSEPEMIEFEGVGKLEAFNTDGLRSIAYTLNAPFMIEKTLRWPGHIDIMRIFRETGLFSREPVTVAGARVRPIDVTSALLFPKWTYADGEEDLTVLRVVVDGSKDGAPTRLTWEMLDFFERSTGTTSMARTTAFPCTSLARAILDSSFEPGVLVPELIGRNATITERVLLELAQRGIHVRSRKSATH